MPDRRHSRLIAGLLAAFAAALGAYDTLFLGGVTDAGGWGPVALYSATALLLLVPYVSDRAREFFHRIARTRPVLAGLVLFSVGALALAVWLVVDVARAPPGEFEAVVAVAFWVLILGGSGVSVLRSVRHGLERDRS
ncbi:hypothetical protein C475_07746 [Halosimplex carlsbadense 2-9-1]|uniref:Uncharacterized protein n=1 Tax=Halosimplex carlsbadense 2-9-1 TaxID=797114 RepID=M0CU84_9EURY|nr:hypothetical protein [Halosimplex carlsbadense]ELZ26810.1 hypothetical protein C475_07746 [Halosimplex carlsbadense 2-9-1]